MSGVDTNAAMATHSQPSPYMIVNGELVPYTEATVHLMSPGMRYGLNVFEGLRAYWNGAENQLYVFRMPEHLERLQQSMKMLRFQAAFSIDELSAAALELLRANEIKASSHIRVCAYLDGDGEHHVTQPVSYFVAAKVRPRSSKTRTGIRCRVSTWTRIADDSMPPRIKCGANYVNARMARLEALQDGYDDALILNARGRVSEGPGACVFMYRQGTLVTPSVTEGILESITRDTLIEIARDNGIRVQERGIDRTELYACDELLMAGSAAEVLPIVEVDRIAVGNGQVGPVTTTLQSAYFDSVVGNRNNDKGWICPAYPPHDTRRTAG